MGPAWTASTWACQTFYDHFVPSLLAWWRLFTTELLISLHNSIISCVLELFVVHETWRSKTCIMRAAPRITNPELQIPEVQTKIQACKLIFQAYKLLIQACTLLTQECKLWLIMSYFKFSCPGLQNSPALQTTTKLSKNLKKVNLDWFWKFSR